MLLAKTALLVFVVFVLTFAPADHVLCLPILCVVLFAAVVFLGWQALHLKVSSTIVRVRIVSFFLFFYSVFRLMLILMYGF